MTLNQFQYMDEAAQELVCLDQGVFLARRIEDNLIYHLYQVSNFYIEVQYNTSSHRARIFTAFESIDRLDPYLRLISIEWI